MSNERKPILAIQDAVRHANAHSTINRLSKDTVEQLSKLDPLQGSFGGITLNHWNHEPWFGRRSEVMGSGPHRVNMYDTDGFAWRQWRFATLDEMIDFLCSCTQRVYRVTGKDAQYWVREHYMEGF